MRLNLNLIHQPDMEDISMYFKYKIHRVLVANFVFGRPIGSQSTSISLVCNSY